MAESGSLLFRRTYEIIIGDSSTNSGLVLTGDDRDDEGLEIDFRINKRLSNKDSSNESEITIHNLSESSVNYIKKETETIVVKLGYDGDNKVVFIGNILEIEEDDRVGDTDKTTTIKARPASTTLYDPTISRTFPAGTTPRAIISYLIGQNSQLAKASFNSDAVNQSLPYGKSVEGTVKQIMDELSSEFNFFYRIDSNRLYVSDVSSYQSENSTTRAFVVSPTTGLLSNPVLAQSSGKRIGKKKDNDVKKDGIRFTSLINPLYQAGQAVQLEDTDMDGTYRINACEFKGSWSSNTWEVECWCSII